MTTDPTGHATGHPVGHPTGHPAGLWLARRTGRSIGRRVTAANVVGAGLVFYYFYFLFLPIGEVEILPSSAVVIGFAGYLLLASMLGHFWGQRIFRPVRRWLEEERPSTPEERDSTLAQPTKQAAWPFVYWLVAALVTGALTFGSGAGMIDTLRVAGGTVAGGLTTCTLAFLLVERTMRPVFALALRDEPPVTVRTLGIRPRLLLSWALGSAVPLLGIGSALVGPGNESVDPDAVVFLVGAALIGGGVMMAIAARSVSEPIEKVRGALRQVRDGRIDLEVEVDDGGEVGLLQAGFNRMLAGLRERERIRDLFGRYVGTEVARHAVERGVEEGGQVLEASVLFVDLIDSTGLAEAQPARRVVEELNRLFEAVVRATGEEGGWVNKFEGDGAMCVFGAPDEEPDHAARALRAARRLLGEVRKLAATSGSLDIGIGVSSGRVVAGNVGAAHRHEYTVVGDPVNEAARLTEEAKRRASRVLASSASIQRGGEEAARWSEVGAVDLRGRSLPSLAYEPKELGVQPTARGLRSPRGG